MILISNDFCHKRKMYNFDPYNVLLVIATNIPVLLMTASVLQINKWLNNLILLFSRLLKFILNKSEHISRHC